MDKEIKEHIAAINSGIIPEGYKKTKVGIVPVEWEVCPLDKYIIAHNEKSTENNQYPVLTSSRKGIFLQSDYYNKQVASEDNTGYNVVPFGYFTYRHMSDDEIFRFNINTIVEKGIVSTLYPVFTTKDLDNNWLLNTLNYGTAFQKYALIQKQGGSRTYMYLEKLRKLKLAFPPLPEQQKIAEILSTQDKLIELQEKKIEQLKELKKAYLQKMFPQKGSKYPELRFKGFTDPWEQRKLGDIADVTKLAGFEFTEHIVYSDKGSIIALRGLNVKNGQLVLDDVKYIDGSNFSKLSRSKLYVNDVLFTYVGTVGELAIIPENDRFYLAPNVSRIRFISDYDAQFMIQEMGSKSFYDNMIFPLIATSSQPALSMENIRKFVITVPKNNIEQHQIATFFANLDSLITLHQRKSEQEKQKKKALMQLLLTGIVRTK